MHEELHLPHPPSCACCDALREQLVALREQLGRIEAAVLANGPRSSSADVPQGRRRANEPRQLLSQRQAAAALGVRRATLSKLIARGVVRAVQKGSRLALARSEVERLLSEGIPSPDAPAPRRRARRARSVEAADDSILKIAL